MVALPGVTSYFDWVVIDTPSGLGLWSWNATFVSDVIVSPVQADEAAERGLTQTIEWVRSIVSGFRPGVSVEHLVRLVVTLVDRDNRVLTEMLREFLRESFPTMLLPVEIRKRAAAAQARAAHEPIFTFALTDTSRGAKEALDDFTHLTEEVLRHEGTIEKRSLASTKRAVGE